MFGIVACSHYLDVPLTDATVHKLFSILFAVSEVDLQITSRKPPQQLLTMHYCKLQMLIVVGMETEDKDIELKGIVAWKPMNLHSHCAVVDANTALTLRNCKLTRHVQDWQYKMCI